MDQGSKYYKNSRSQGTATCPVHKALCAGLTETDETIVPVPADNKPAPAQVPPVAAPVEARDAAAAVLIQPDRAREDKNERPPTLGNLAHPSDRQACQTQHTLGVALAGHLPELCGAGEHDFALHVQLALLQELDELQSRVTLKRNVREELPAVIALVVDEVGRNRENHLVHCFAFFLVKELNCAYIKA